MAAISGGVTEIAGDAAEQSTSPQGINAAIGQMESSTQQNAVIVEESTAATYSFKNKADELTERIQRLRIQGALADERRAQRIAAPQAARPPRQVAAEQRLRHTPPGAQTEKRPTDIADGREFAFTADDFRQIADLVHTNTGIRMPEYKSAMVYSRLAKRLRALGLDSFREYCRLVLDHQGVDERQKMLAALTTNMTSFFREPHHFDHLRLKVLPPLLDAARRGGRVRVWSAGCSSGEEPYSIALTILSLLPEAPQHDVKVLATDINPNVLDKGRKGAPIRKRRSPRWAPS